MKPVNEISFALHDHEIQSFNIGADIEYGQVLSESAELMTYEQIKALTDDELQNNLIIAGSYTDSCICISLEYALIDDMNGSVIAPVWNYYTALQSETQNGYPIMILNCYCQ